MQSKGREAYRGGRGVGEGGIEVSIAKAEFRTADGREGERLWSGECSSPNSQAIRLTQRHKPIIYFFTSS